MPINATATQYVEFSITSPSGTNTYTQRIARWLEGTHRLVPVWEYGNLQRTSNSIPVVSGPSMNEHYRMAGEAWLTQAEYQAVSRIIQVHAAHIRAYSTSVGIIVDYLYKPITEFGARSRPIVVGTTETTLDSESVEYYPRFKMHPVTLELTDEVRNPAFSHILKMEMVELGRLAP